MENKKVRLRPHGQPAAFERQQLQGMDEKQRQHLLRYMRGRGWQHHAKTLYRRGVHQHAINHRRDWYLCLYKVQEGLQ